jgi:hypothetical protein
VVTLLTPLEPELELEPTVDPELTPELEPVLELDPDDPELLVVVVAAGVDATVVADEAVEALRASAGSWPDTSTIVIISQAATNSATAPEITRRRILRARAARSARSAWPRARAASLLSVIGCMGPASVRAVSTT